MPQNVISFRDISQLTPIQKKDIPNHLNIVGFSLPQDWVRNGYPDYEKKVDYYVKYESVEGLVKYALIEASKSELKKKIRQMRTSADIFSKMKMPVDMFIIVLNGLNRRSIKSYITKNSTSPYFLQVHRKQGRCHLNAEKIGKTKILLIYRDLFKKLRNSKEGKNGKS